MKPPAAVTGRGALALPVLAGTLAAFAGVLTGGALYYRDISLLHRPVRHMARALWSAGTLPLLDPAVDGGRQLLANPNHRLLHPTALLDLVMGVDRALAAAAILQVFLAGWGLALLLRRQGAGNAAARIGGLAFALSGPVLSLGNLPNLLAGVAWVPWIVLSGLASRRAPARHLPPAMLCAAVPLLAGGVESLGAALLILGLMALAAPGRGRGVALVAAQGAGGALLAGIILAPALATLRGSERGLGFRPEQLYYWSLEPARLLEMLVPGLWGVPTDPSRWWGSALFDGGVPLMLSAYLGATVMVLTLTSAVLRRRRRPAAPAGALPGGLAHLVLATGATGAVLLFLALGRHNPLLALGGEVPLAGAFLRFPERLLPLVALPFAVAAGAGWQLLTAAVATQGRLPRAAWLAPAVVAMPLLAAVGWAAAGRHPLAGTLPGGTDERAAGALLAAAGTGLAAVALIAACFWLLTRERTRFLAGGCAAAVVALDLLAAGAGLNPTAEPSILQEMPEVARQIHAHQDGAERPRVLRLQEPPIPGEEIPPGVEVAWSRRSLAYRIPEEVGLAASLISDVDRATPLGNTFLRRAHEGAQGAARERLADRAAAGWEVGFAAGRGAVPADALWADAVFPRAPLLVLRRRGGAAPRLHVVPRGTRLGSLREAGVLAGLISRMSDPASDPRAEVFLTGPPGEDVVGGWEPGQAALRVLVDEPTEMIVETELPGPGVLVVRDSFVAGWRVWVDGAAADIVRADLAWRGVVLPRGPHRVRFTYRQPGLRAGAGLTAAGLVLCLGLALFSRRIANRRPTAAP